MTLTSLNRLSSHLIIHSRVPRANAAQTIEPKDRPVSAPVRTNAKAGAGTPVARTSVIDDLRRNDALLSSISRASEAAGGRFLDAAAVVRADHARIQQTLSPIEQLTRPNYGPIAASAPESPYVALGVSAQITEIHINYADLSNPQPSLPVTLDVFLSAQTAEVYFSTGSFFESDHLEQFFTLESNLGSNSFTLVKGMSQAEIVDAINEIGNEIGVSAVQSSVDTHRVEIRSRTFGSSQFVRASMFSEHGAPVTVFATTATAAVSQSDLQDFGRDLGAYINRTLARTQGLTARISSDELELSLSIDGSAGLNVTDASETFEIHAAVTV